MWALFVPAADWLAHHDVGSAAGPLHETALDNARGRLLTLGAGLAAAGALVFTALNFNLLRRNSEQADQWQRRNHELTEQGQVTDRYTKAIEQLGSDKLDVRIGGIYALERIARDSARDHPTVMEVLTAFIREHSHERWSPPGPDDWETGRGTRPDIQAAITVLGRRDRQHDTRRIDLTAANLSGANLHEVRSRGPFSGADLSGAILWSADLSHAVLPRADLSGADLMGARLTGAFLDGANLSQAHLRSANLTEASLTNARLTGAALPDADLTGADLIGADLTLAILARANLTRADLTRAIWPGDVQVPEGWKRDTSSGRLEEADTGAESAEAN